MPFPIDVSRCLAYAPVDEPLKLECIPSERLRASLAVDGLHEGDEIRCQRDSRGRVLVTTAENRRIIVDPKYAVRIEVGRLSAPMTVVRSDDSERHTPLRAPGRLAARRVGLVGRL